MRTTMHCRHIRGVPSAKSNFIKYVSSVFPNSIPTQTMLRVKMGSSNNSLDQTPRWWRRLRLLIQAIGILRAASGRTDPSEVDSVAVDHLMLEANSADQRGMEQQLQELITTRPFLNHSDEEKIGNHDKVRNPRQSWVRILALVRFIAVAKIAAARRPSKSNYLQDLESGPISDDATLHEETCGEMQLLQRININRIVQEKKWDEFYDFGGVAGFAEALNSNLENGIVGDTEDIRIRNAMMIKFPQTCLFCLLFEALGGWTIFLLAVAIILSFAFGVDEEGIQKCWLDNLILLMSIVGLIMFRLAWIYWEDKKLMKKTKERKRKTQRETEEVRVIRGGIEGPIPNSDLVYGDIVCLRKGDLVPANGIFVSNCGEPLEVLDDDDDVECLCINDHNPFLLLGSKVIEGDAKMIVTSLFVGNEADQWTERMRRAITKSTSHTGFDFDACFEKLRSKIHVVGLVISILTFVVLFVHFKFQQKDYGKHEYELEIEEEPAKFSQIVNFIRKFAIDIKLTTLLCLSIVGMTEGLSVVVSSAIVYWKRKGVVSYKDYSKIDTALLLKVESSVTTIVCSVKNDWLTEENHQEVIRDIAVKTLTELGEVQTMFVSQDDVDELKNIVREVGLVNNPNNNNSDGEALSLMVIDGEEFHQFSDADKMEKIDRICIMGNCSLTQKLLLVKTLKLKGKVVLMLGEGKSDGLVIEKADFGMYIDTWSFDYLIGMLKLGRFISGNVKKFIQVELILTLASWSINLITVIIMGNSPFTTLELIWLNFLVTFPGGLSLFTGQLEDECLSVDKSKPVIISKAMWRNIIIQVTYQISISVALQCKGRDKIIFNGFALCQFFSILCAREPEKKNIFKAANYWFWATCGVFLFLQVAFVEAATLLSSDSLRLDWKLWAVCFLIGAATCFFDWAGKFATQYSMAAVVASASLCTIQHPLVNQWFTRFSL